MHPNTVQRALRVAACSLALALVVSGCGTGGGGASTPAEPKEPEQAYSDPKSCDDYLALSDANKQQFLKWYSIDYDVSFIYDENGTTPITPLELAAQSCAGGGSSETWAETVAAMEAFDSQDQTDCSTFKKLPKPAQNAWIQGVIKDTGWSRSDVTATMLAESLPLICADFQLGDLHGSAFKLSQLANAQSPLYERYASEKPKRLWTYSVTNTAETKQGYEYQVTVKYSRDIRWTTGHPLQSDYLPGSSCSFNPDTDIAIPAVVTMKNITPKSASIEPLFTTGGLMVERRRNPKNSTSARVTMMHDTGASCSSQDHTQTVSGSSIEPLEPGESISGAAFIIIQNYFSPKNPKGNKANLADYLVAPSPGWNEDVVEWYKTLYRRVLGDGTKIGTNLYTWKGAVG